ncbi:MAG: hypothetical protein ACJ76Y_32490 [Thermoanaerobaculia bacterium]
MRKLLPLLVLPLALGLAAPAHAEGSCSPMATHLCLHYGRFQVDVDWMLPGGIAGKGQAVPLTDDTGSFWFFDNANLELVVKVLDGRPVNGHFWVYYGGLSDVEYRLTVTDTATGIQEIYVNPAGRLASGSDTAAFDPEPLGFPGDSGPGLPEGVLPSRLGPEMQVNVTTLGNQWEPAVAVGPDGGFMVVWQGPPAGLQGRLYDAAGRPRGGEIVLAASSQPEQPRVAADVSGRFLVVWNDAGQVKGRLFGPDGQPATEEIAVGFSPRQPGLPDVVADPAGGFLVAWPEYGDDTLRLLRFSALGKPMGSEVALARRGSDVRLAAYPVGGGFVLAWIESFGFLETNVLALRLDSSARPIGTAAARANIDVQRRNGYHQAPVPVVHPDGGFSVVWTTRIGTLLPQSLGIYARRYGADGQPAGLVRQVSEGYGIGDWKGNAVALPSGRVMVLWYEQRTEDVDGGTFARLFDASWQPLGSSFRINTYTQNLQILPAAAADAAGNVVAAWTSTVPSPPLIPELPPEFFGTGQDGDGSGVFAQRFTTASCPGTDQLCLNGGRFHVAVQYTDPRSGETRPGQAAPLTGDSGAFWFFAPSNAELLIKVLDARPVNGHFWVFYGALSDVEYTITVTDTVTGKRRTYHNDLHHQGSRSDVTAFAAGSR